MANSRDWGSPQQQEMLDFDSANNFSPGDGFNIGELSGMEGTYDFVLYVCCSEKRNIKHTPTIIVRLLVLLSFIFVFIYFTYVMSKVG
jgi:hypothetical protein